MKNSDMPAMPFEIGDEAQGSRWWSGLTKREMMAATLPDIEIKVDYKAIPELIGRDVDWNDMRDVIKAGAEVEAIQRVIRADAILAELERTCQKP